VLELTLALGCRPVPYLLAVAMASNIGSTATITGNPQNIMIAHIRDEESCDPPGGQFPARRGKFPARLNKFPVRRELIPCFIL
jgi:hypothetical protein